MPWKSKPRMPGWKPHWLEQPILVIEPTPPAPVFVAPEPVIVEPTPPPPPPEPVIEAPVPFLETVVEEVPPAETPVWSEPEVSPEANTAPVEEETV